MGGQPPGPPTNFGQLAHRISAWTTNLLAAAIVIAIGLALGWQITSWWREKPAPSDTANLSTAAASLPQVDGEREFWTKSGLLKVQRITGTPDDALAAMRAFCREKTTADAPRTTGQGEAAFVTQLLAEQPLEESPPLALYQPPGQAAMIVAVDRESRQIVSWSFALPTSGSDWSLYHFRPK
jgi:hypothetical protein